MDVFLEKPQVDGLERAERHEPEPRRRPEDGCHSTRDSRPHKAPSAKGRVTAMELWRGGAFSFFCHMGHRANIWTASPVMEACRAGADRPGRQKQRWLRSRTVVGAVVEEDELAP